MDADGVDVLDELLHLLILVWFQGVYHHHKMLLRLRKCVGSKRGAFWLFDLSELPEDATILSASFKGDTEYSDQGDTTFAVKPTSGTLTTSFAQSIINAPSWSSRSYTWGGPFTLNIPSRRSRLLATRESWASISTLQRRRRQCAEHRAAGRSIVHRGGHGIRKRRCCLSSGTCVVVPQHT